MRKKYFSKGIHILLLFLFSITVLLLGNDTLYASSEKRKDAILAQVDCKKNPIYCQIKLNRPELNDKYAMHISNIIHKKSRKYKIDARVLTAILAQESGYNQKAMNCKKGFDAVELEKGNVKVVKVCFDFGIGEINYRQILRRKIDLFRIMEDLDYAVDIAAKMMSEFETRHGKNESDYWTRYNAHNTIMRDIYKGLVARYL